MNELTKEEEKSLRDLLFIYRRNYPGRPITLLKAYAHKAILSLREISCETHPKKSFECNHESEQECSNSYGDQLKCFKCGELYR